jgi:hypothetical protein
MECTRMTRMMRHLISCLILSLAIAALGCDDTLPPIVVNSLEDVAESPKGTVTLRSALRQAASGQAIVFDEHLDGGTIELSLVDAEHSRLGGEVMGIRMEPSGPVSYLVGWFERDYGRSALYARKDVVIDASDLASGITLAWTGAEGDDARVLAVFGDLVLINVSITGGRSVTEDISTGDPDDQPWTLARGAGVAVWGVAWLEDCRIHDNHARGDFDQSRDRGAFGGGVYADVVRMKRCVVSGNTVVGAGAAGGGVFSVGGVFSYQGLSSIERSAITGNRISGLFTYGGGVYSDGGGIGNAGTLTLTNTTIARNRVEPAPGLPPFVLAMGYWRGGGAYMSNGTMRIQSSTIVENEVHGVPRTDSLSRPNLAGGVAATIGNAHAVENLVIGHSIVAGNTVHEIGGESYAHDIFTGSLFYFKSMGHNRIGVIDFSQMLVPVGQWDWFSLSRRHYPKIGDEHGLDLEDVVNLDSGVTVSDSIRSAGTDAGEFAVLHYEPIGAALDQVPSSPYPVYQTVADYRVDGDGPDDFIAIVLDRIEDEYTLAGFAGAFTVDFEAFLASVDIDDETEGLQPYLDPGGDPILTLADTQWFGPREIWPRELPNHPWIEFWHRLDVALLAEEIGGMGPEALGDDAWGGLFQSGSLVENRDITIRVDEGLRMNVRPSGVDQLGESRPAGTHGDIGAIELP